jgi:hypothetical protein
MVSNNELGSRENLLKGVLNDPLSSPARVVSYGSEEATLRGLGILSGYPPCWATASTEYTQ